MGQLDAIIQQYLPALIEPKINEIALNLENSIKDETPVDTGRLQSSIRVDTRISGLDAVITGYFDEGIAPYGKYVLSGSAPVNGKPMRMPWGWRTKRRAIPPNDFMGRGLANVIAMYR